MPAAIPIAVAAITAAGAAGGAAIQARGAAAAARTAGRAPRGTNIPAPKRETALANMYSRILASNIDAVPPSFGEFTQSGGKATFPIKNPGITPREAVNLGLVAHGGGDVPFLNPATGEANPEQFALTPAQLLFLGAEQAQAGHGSPLVKALRKSQRLNTLQSRPDTPKRDSKEARLIDQINKILERQSNRFKTPEGY